jgi:hypothetical protein
MIVDLKSIDVTIFKNHLLTYNLILTVNLISIGKQYEKWQEKTAPSNMMQLL